LLSCAVGAFDAVESCFGAAREWSENRLKKQFILYIGSLWLHTLSCLHAVLGHSMFGEGHDLCCGSDDSGSPFEKLPSG
jgi:hypothetical protein